MQTIGIYFGTSGGVTTGIVDEIEFYLKKQNYKIHDVAGGIQGLDDYQNLILIAPTYGVGELEPHWEKVLPDLERMDLKGKIVGLVGLGNQVAFGESFVGGLKILYDVVVKNGGIIVGETSTKGYHYEESDAVVNNMFVGLVIDEANQSDKTPDRVADWISEIKPFFK